MVQIDQGEGGSGMNRRGFLKTFLAAAAGTAIAPIVAPVAETVIQAVAAPEILRTYPVLKSPVGDLCGHAITAKDFDRAKKLLIERMDRPQTLVVYLSPRQAALAKRLGV